MRAPSNEAFRSLEPRPFKVFCAILSLCPEGRSEIDDFDDEIAAAAGAGVLSHVVRRCYPDLEAGGWIRRVHRRNRRVIEILKR
jgi:hypothetical protein